MFQYGGDKKEQLLPSDAKTRAVVDQRMYFDMGTFYKAVGDCVYPIMFGSGAKFVIIFMMLMSCLNVNVYRRGG